MKTLAEIRDDLRELGAVTRPAPAYRTGIQTALGDLEAVIGSIPGVYSTVSQKPVQGPSARPGDGIRGTGRPEDQ